MLQKLLLVLIVLIGIVFGSLISAAFIFKLPELGLNRGHYLHRILGLHEHEVIGFLPYWLVKSTPISYEPYLTTLTYFGLVLQEDGTIQKKVNPQESEPGWNMLGSAALKERLTEAKKTNITTSLLIHLADEEKIEKLLTSPEQHATNLMAEVSPLMMEYGFSDLNIDIESFKEASPAAQLAFTTFIAAIKQELITRNLGTLTIEISPSALIKPFLIDPYEVGKIVDRIVLMAYDYHYSGSFSTGPVAPLAGAGTTREFDVTISMQEAERVIHKKKLILGIPLYGYEWETVQPKSDTAVIPGSGRSATNKRIAELLLDCPLCQTGIEPTSEESFVIYPDPKDKSYRVVFIGGSELMKAKLQRAQHWAGAAVWALGYEDEHILKPLEGYKNHTFLLW